MNSRMLPKLALQSGGLGGFVSVRSHGPQLPRKMTLPVVSAFHVVLAFLILSRLAMPWPWCIRYVPFLKMHVSPADIMA